MVNMPLKITADFSFEMSETLLRQSARKNHSGTQFDTRFAGDVRIISRAILTVQVLKKFFSAFFCRMKSHKERLA